MALRVRGRGPSWIAAAVLCAFASASEAQVVFVPGDWPAQCAVRLKGEIQLKIPRDGCARAPSFRSAEYQPLQVARDELAQLQPGFFGTVILVDDRAMGVEMRVLFDDLVFPGADRATLLSGTSYLGRDPILVIGLVDSEGLSESAWRETVRVLGRSGTPLPASGDEPACSASQLDEQEAEDFRKLVVISSTVRELGINFVKRRKTAIQVLINHVGAEEVKAREKFKLTRTVLRAMGSQVVGLATENGSKLVQGESIKPTAGGGVVMAAKAAFSIIRATVAEYERVKKQNADVGRDESRADAMEALLEQAQALTEAVWGVQETARYLKSRYCVMNHRERDGFMRGLDAIYGDHRKSKDILDAYYGTQDQVELATVEGYIRVAGKEGRPGVARVSYEYDEDESREGSTYTFERKPPARIDVARGGEALERKLNGLMEDLEIRDLFELDLEFELCTQGDWSEGSPGERSVECTSVTPFRCVRPASGSKGSGACAEVDWTKTSRNAVRRAIIRTPSNVFHFNAQSALNRTRPDWMESWRRFRSE